SCTVSGLYFSFLFFTCFYFLPPPPILKECVKYYNNNYNEAVVALLDQNLPPSLSIPAASTSESSPLEFEPRSIYDNDEFDILRRNDVDLSRIHIGKKKKTPASLDDKGHDKVLKVMYEKYSIVQDVVDGEGLYEDEYDDTYDSNDVGLEEPAPESELSERRPFTVPRVLEPKSGRKHENRYEEDADSVDRRARASLKTWFGTGNTRRGTSHLSITTRGRRLTTNAAAACIPSTSSDPAVYKAVQ
ncbi:hypothetical protein V5799_027263, partial [Amblyomma americanum]